MIDCIFCRIVSGEVPSTVVHETAGTLAFRDIKPQAPSHVLVIPKEHHGDVATLADSDSALAGELLGAVAAVADKEGLTIDGFRVIFNVGEFGGQDVQHAHAHVVGGRPLGRMLPAL